MPWRKRLDWRRPEKPEVAPKNEMKHCRLLRLLWIGMALLPISVAFSQQLGARAGQAKIDAASVARGNQVYRPNCGFCHGLDARGAAGPDLARSLIVLKDVDGKELGSFLNSGRPEAGMPAFASLSPEQSADLAAFLHAKI